MGFGRMLFSKTFRVVMPFAGVVVPVGVLLHGFQLAVNASPYVFDDVGMIVGGIVFTASILYMGWKLEKAVEQEDDWIERRKGN